MTKEERERAEKSVKALRECARFEDCQACPYAEKFSPSGKCQGKMLEDAAGAIELLLKELEERA